MKCVEAAVVDNTFELILGDNYLDKAIPTSGCLNFKLQFRITVQAFWSGTVELRKVFSRNSASPSAVGGG